MPLTITTARLVMFGFYMQSLSGTAGKSPAWVNLIWQLLQYMDTIAELEAALPPPIGHCWNNYKLLWPHEDM